MKLWNFYELEQLSKDKKMFYVFLDDFMEKHSIEDTLEMLRVSGICFNLYNRKQVKRFEEVISKVKEKFPESEQQIKKFVETVNVLSAIIEDFFTLRSSRQVDTIPQNRQILSFIISLEIMLGSIIEYINGHSLTRIKQVYPFVFALFDENRQRIVEAKNHINRITDIADSIAEFAGSLLKFLGATNGNLGKLETVSMHQVRIAREHIELFDNWSTLVNLEQKWRFIGADLVTEEEEQVRVEIKNETFLKAQEISKVRFRSQRNKWFADFNNLSNKDDLYNRINPNATKLPPEQYLCEEEVFFCIAIGEFLATYSLDVKCLNVSLSEWIRAYMVIQTEARKHLEDRFNTKVVKPLIIENWTIYKERKYWLNLFVERGISVSSAEIIVNTFTFSNESKDLLDCPFVAHNDHLLLIPSVASHIDPSMSLVSLLAKNNVDVSFKGQGLETDILKKLNEKGILAKKLKHVYNGETFECDTVFMLNDDLFYVELKHFGQPLTLREYYSLLLKLQGPSEKFNQKENERSAVEQLNRIVNFYQNNLHLVNKELGLPNDWVPKNVYKIILTTAMLGESIFLDECYIVDYSVFNRFLDRTPPGIAIGKVFLRPRHEDYEGDITSEKLINILRNPPQIELGNIRVRKEYRSITLQSKTVNYPLFHDCLGDFIEYDKALIQKLGIDMDQISKIETLQKNESYQKPVHV